jgi:CubicO group peptidase (beta-lactamase class C family)
MKSNLPLSCICLLLLVMSLHAASQPYDETLAGKIDTIFKKYTSKTGPGAAVAVLKDGRVIFKKAYGIANLEYGVPINSSTVFDIASLSKQFTGLSVSLLVQQGKIALDDDLHKFIPEVPAFGKTITIRELLWHTSGIRDAYDGLTAAGWRWNDVFTFGDIMKFLRNQRQLNFEPGSQFSYCNTEYALLQAIVEKVSGQSFIRYTDSAIFKPLGMHSSFYLSDYAKVIPCMAMPYQPGEHGFEKTMQQSSGYSMFSTLDDLIQWTLHFNERLAAGDPVYIRMAEQGKLNDGSITHYGFGLILSDDHGLPAVWHTGAWGGYRNSIRNYPTEKLSVIILSNGDDNSMNMGYSGRVLDLFLKDKYKPEEKVNVAKLPNVNVNPDLLKSYAGTYHWGGGEMQITAEKGQLSFQYNGEPKQQAKPMSDSSFVIVSQGYPIVFKKNPKGQANFFLYRSFGGNRFTTYIPKPVRLEDFTGTYYSEELHAIYTIDVLNGKLFLHHFRRGDFELTNDSEDGFSGDAGTIHFIRDGNKQVIGFNLSDDNIQNIRFDKNHN